MDRLGMKSTCSNAEEQINRVKDKSESREGKQFSVQHVCVMHSTGPSEVI